MKKVCIVSIDRENGILIQDILTELFSDLFETVVFSIAEELPEMFNFDVILCTSADIETRLLAKKEVNSEKFLYARMSFQKEHLKKLGRIHGEKKALLISNDEGTTKEMIETITSLGIKDVELYPYYPDGADYPHLTTAITTHNELKHVPDFIEEIIDIGNRGIDPFILLQLMTKLDLLDHKTLDIINAYASAYIFMLDGYFNLCTEAVSTKIKLKEVVNSMRDGIILCKKNQRIEFANRRSEEIFNLPMDYLQEKNISALFSDYQVTEIEIEDCFENVVVILGKSYFLRIKMDRFSSAAIVVLSDLDEIKNIEYKSKNFLKAGHRAKYTFHNIIGRSQSITMTIEKAKKFAKSELPILIEGESGTGKELLAGAIHNYSPRSGYAFVAFNCAAMNESLIESELFGYEDGAFTGASRKGKAGLFEIANGGTVFLDEIGDMPLSLQVKLLRVLQEKEMIRVGGTDLIHVDLRVIAATNKNLQEMVEEGSFRRDLYYRICVLSLFMPGLQARRDDLDLLIRYFKDKYDADFSLTDRAYRYLQQYSWPGNIRELENFVQYMKVIEKTQADILDFPNNMMKRTSENKEELSSMDRIILRILDEQRIGQSGLGRTEICRALRENKVECSEMQVRRRLHFLQEGGYISITIGRGGTVLTEQGKQYLEDHEKMD